jgi:hypothetical protein
MKYKKPETVPAPFQHHGLPPGASVRRAGEYFEVCFSRRGQRVATLSADKSEAVKRSWNFWRVGGNPATQFADILTNALTK